MTCPHCNAPVTDNARFCGVCGKATVATESVLGVPDLPDDLRIIGREIAGRYRIIGKLGEGGMGAVYRAEQLSLKRACAVKLLRPEVSGNAQLARRFNAEAQVFARLSHPNTVNIYDFGQDSDGALFIAMELVDGESLRAILRRGPLSPRRALHIAAQVAASLADAHAHTIVHRDLKPDNVMIQERGKQKDVARVLDFGIAKLRDDSRATREAMTQAGDLLGTPQYMAPEQIRGETIDGRTDVYALGCMIYEMVTGRMPFEADTVVALLAKHLTEGVVPPTQRRPDLGLPAELDPLVLVAMNKQAIARPTTMELYGEMIAKVAASLPMDAATTAHPAQPAMSVVAPSAYAAQQAPASAPGMPMAVGPAPSQLVPAMAQPPQMPTPMTPMSHVPTPMYPSHGPASNGQAYTPAPGRSRIWIPIAAIGAIAVIGLIALGVEHQHSSSTAHDDASVAPGPTPDPTPNPPPGPTPRPPGPNPHPPNPPGPDPWADNAASASPCQGPTLDDDDSILGPAPKTPYPTMIDTKPVVDPIPTGVLFETPLGFDRVEANNGITNIDKSRGVFVTFGTMFRGSNDPKILAQTFEKTFNARFDGFFGIEALGETRCGSWFHGVLANVNFRISIVTYVGQGYRVAVGFLVPEGIATDPKLLAELRSIAEDNVHLP